VVAQLKAELAEVGADLFHVNGLVAVLDVQVHVELVPAAAQQLVGHLTPQVAQCVQGLLDAVLVDPAFVEHRVAQQVGSVLALQIGNGALAHWH